MYVCVYMWYVRDLLRVASSLAVVLLFRPVHHPFISIPQHITRVRFAALAKPALLRKIERVCARAPA